MTSLIYDAWLPKQASCSGAGTMWAEKKNKKKNREDKEELSEVKARAVACLELRADAQPLLLCVSRALWEN